MNISHFFKRSAPDLKTDTGSSSKRAKCQQTDADSNKVNNPIKNIIQDSEFAFRASKNWKGKTYKGPTRRTQEEAVQDLETAKLNIAKNIRPFPQFQRKHGNPTNNSADTKSERRKSQDMEGKIIAELIEEHRRQQSVMTRVRDGCLADNVFSFQDSVVVADQVKTCKTEPPGHRAWFQNLSDGNKCKYHGMLVTCVDTRDNVWWLFDGSKLDSQNFIHVSASPVRGRERSLPMPSRWRHFSVIDKNPDDETKWEALHDAKYWVFGRQLASTTGTFQHQGHISFRSVKTLEQVRKLMDKCDVRPTDSPQASIAYCKKDGDFREWGKAPMIPPNRGRMRDTLKNALLDQGLGLVSLVAARIKHLNKAIPTTLHRENLRSTLNFRKEYAMEVLVAAVFRNTFRFSKPFRENDVCDQIRHHLVTGQQLRQQNKVVHVQKKNQRSNNPGFSCNLMKSQCRIGKRKQLKQPYAVGDNDIYTFAYWDTSGDTPWALIWDIPESAWCLQQCLQTDKRQGQLSIQLHVPASIRLPPNYSRVTKMRETKMARDTMQYCRKICLLKDLTNHEYRLFTEILAFEDNI